MKYEGHSAGIGFSYLPAEDTRRDDLVLCWNMKEKQQWRFLPAEDRSGARETMDHGTALYRSAATLVGL